MRTRRRVIRQYRIEYNHGALGRIVALIFLALAVPAAIACTGGGEQTEPPADIDATVEARVLGTQEAAATLTPTATLALPLRPTNIRYDIAPDVPAEQVEVITTGLQMAQDFLDSELGGGIPEEARSGITVKIVATGKGDEEQGGSCCSGFAGSPNGISTMRLFFDIAHPDTSGFDNPTWERQAVKLYTSIWQHHVGCSSRPLPAWLKDGLRDFIRYGTAIKSGYLRRSDVMEHIYRGVRITGQLDKPLRDFGERGEVWPGDIGYLALDRLVAAAPGGIGSLRTLCEEAAGGASAAEAFETAFGVSLEDFYADFEEYRKELNAPPAATGVKLAVGPTNIRYDIAPNVPAEEVEIIATGLQMAQDFLDSELGGGIPEEARSGMTVKIVATGLGNQEPGGGEACCTGLSQTRGVSTMRPFFDVAHPQWGGHTNRKIGTAIHEYAHNWQHHLGCISKFYQPLGNWLSEGMAEYITYEAMIDSGIIDRSEFISEVIEANLSNATRSGQFSRPLRDFAEGAIADIGIHPGTIGLIALHRLVPSAPGGIMSLRTICEKVAAIASDPSLGGTGMFYPEAFETAFGVSLEDFYADFEEYRLELNPSAKKPTETHEGTAEAGQPESVPPDFKVAFIGDQGLNRASRSVLRMIKDEGADMVLHQGDFDYQDNPDLWDQQINQVLGDDFPYFASIGNHDVLAWENYQRKLEARLARISGARCTGDLGVNSSCTYKGLFFVLSGVGTRGSGHVSFIKEALASPEARESLWRICSWHTNQRLMQVGSKGDQVGWEPYEECRKGGAIIATGHEHSYSRTHLMDSFDPQVIASAVSPLRIARGQSFAFVSGLGGQSIRGQDDQLAAKPWWAAVHTSAKGADYGALFCTFNHNGVENRAHCYFKDLNGVIADEFEVIAEGASDSPTLRPTPTPTGVKLPLGPTNIRYDIADNVPMEQVEFVASGLQIAQDFLDSELGGGISEDARHEITIKLVATGRGDEEPGGGGACCTASSKMQIFLDFDHTGWGFKRGARRPWTLEVDAWDTVVHEYAHLWNYHLGCLSKPRQPLGNWLVEGMAQFIANETFIKRGDMQRADVDYITFESARGLFDRPLRNVAEGSVRDLPQHPGRIGALALSRLVPSAPNGMLSLRTICEEVAAGATVPEAFETAFGVSLEDFYADFEEYRQELNQLPELLVEPRIIDLGFIFDVDPDVPAGQMDIIKSGFQAAQNLLDRSLDGGIPKDAQQAITVEIVADEQSNTPNCCTIFGGVSEQSDLRPFFNVAHSDWTSRGQSAQLWRATREFMYLWQHQVGCLSYNNRPLGVWLTEGIGFYLTFEGRIGARQLSRQQLIENDILFWARSKGQLSRPLQEFESHVAGIWPSHVGYLAVHSLVQSAPDGILSLRTVCEEAAGGASAAEAFETAFGVSLEDFYADFEEYRKELLSE